MTQPLSLWNRHLTMTAVQALEAMLSGQLNSEGSSGMLICRSLESIRVQDQLAKIAEEVLIDALCFRYMLLIHAHLLGGQPLLLGNEKATSP